MLRPFQVKIAIFLHCLVNGIVRKKIAWIVEWCFICNSSAFWTPALIPQPHSMIRCWGTVQRDCTVPRVETLVTLSLSVEIALIHSLKEFPSRNISLIPTLVRILIYKGSQTDESRFSNSFTQTNIISYTDVHTDSATLRI